VLQRDRIRTLVELDEAARELEKLPVNRLKEMLRLEEIGNPIERFVIDQHGAKQRLFRLDIMRQCADRDVRGWLSACNRIDLCHGPDQGIRMWPICGQPL